VQVYSMGKCLSTSEPPNVRKLPSIS
jgi:hypothetical protein